MEVTRRRGGLALLVVGALISAIAAPGSAASQATGARAGARDGGATATGAVPAAGAGVIATGAPQAVAASAAQRPAETRPAARTRILLIRHGHSAGDPFATPERPVHGFLAEPLGVQQAEATAAALKNTRIDLALSSPYGRALQTAEIVLRSRDVPIRVLPALREWLPNRELEKASSTMWESVQRQAADRYAEETWKTELGEGTYEMYARMVPPFLAELDQAGIHSRMGGFVIDEKARGTTIAVFAHGGTLNVLLSHLLGLRPFPVGAFSFEETGLAVVELPELRGIAHPQLVIRAPHDVGR